MKATAWVVGLGLASVGTAGSAGAAPYDGVWGSNAAACRDQDGVDRMLIKGLDLDWYETHCRASRVRPDGSNAWTMRLACRGEGQRFTARPRLTLPAPGQLVMENGPVGPGKRQSYVRCAGY